MYIYIFTYMCLSSEPSACWVTISIQFDSEFEVKRTAK